MSNETITRLSDSELTALIANAQAEIAARKRRHKDETIAKIRALAGDIGVSISINGARGRPSKARVSANTKSLGRD